MSAFLWNLTPRCATYLPFVAMQLQLQSHENPHFLSIFKNVVVVVVTLMASLFFQHKERMPRSCWDLCH